MEKRLLEMYETIEILNFRCFENFEVGPLESVNLFTGKNNVGKTALLEAIWLQHGYQNPELGFRVDAFRGLDRINADALLTNLFHDFDQEKTITVSCRFADGKISSLKISAQEASETSIPVENIANRQESDTGSAPSKPKLSESQSDRSVLNRVAFEYTDMDGLKMNSYVYMEGSEISFKRKTGIKKPLGVFLSARRSENQPVLAERLSSLTLEKKHGSVVKILRTVEPDLQDLTTQFIGGSPVVYGDVGGATLIPLPLLGDGVCRLLSICLAVPTAKNGVLLIDEIENGFHYSVMEKVWKAVVRFAGDYNVQIFATTHSWECISAFQTALSDLSEEKISGALFRLEKTDSGIRSIPYSVQELAISTEQEIEVR